MNRRRHNPWLRASLIASAAVVTLARFTPASAQTAPGSSVGRASGPFVTTVQPANPRRPQQAVEQPTTLPVESSPGAGDPDRPGDPTLDPDDADTRRPIIGRRPPVDGDPTWPPQPTQPIDGVVDPVQPEQPVDGADPTLVDTRSPEEYGPFEIPRVEPETTDDPFIELEPILDRRPARLARFEPFDPVGIRRGGFIIFPEAEISVAALDNLFRSRVNPRSDVFLDVRPSVRVVSNWRQHAVEFRATGLSTFHNHFPSEDDRGGSFEGRGRIDLSRRTNLEFFGGWSLAQEARGSINAPSRLGDRADIETRRTGVIANHRFNRLSLQLRGSVTDVDYSGTRSETGVYFTNNERDVRTTEVAARAQWEFKPTFSVFAESAVNWRDYGGVPADGISRESQGERNRVGISFGSASKIVRGEISIGQGHQQFQDSRLPEIRGVIVDANLAWRVSGLTSLLLTARSDVGESTLAGSGGSMSRTAQLELRHAFQRHLIGTAGLRMTQQDYEGVTLTEREVAALAGLEYYLNREVTLFGRYQHVNFDSTISGRDYNSDEVRVGVRVRR